MFSHITALEMTGGIGANLTGARRAKLGKKRAIRIKCMTPTHYKYIYFYLFSEISARSGHRGKGGRLTKGERKTFQQPSIYIIGQRRHYKAQPEEC